MKGDESIVDRSIQCTDSPLLKSLKLKSKPANHFHSPPPPAYLCHSYPIRASKHSPDEPFNQQSSLLTFNRASFIPDCLKFYQFLSTGNHCYKVTVNTQQFCPLVVVPMLSGESPRCRQSDTEAKLPIPAAFDSLSATPSHRGSHLSTWIGCD